jgi:protein gp37
MVWRTPDEDRMGSGNFSCMPEGKSAVLFQTMAWCAKDLTGRLLGGKTYDEMPLLAA